MQQLQPWDPRATSVIWSSFPGLLEIMAYVLEITASVRACSAGAGNAGV